MVPFTVLGLLALTVLAATGKRSNERNERELFVGLLAERQLRCRAEFKLAQADASSSAPGAEL
eukprot:3098655-Pyramimonas_sp.AAC.1